MSESGGSSVKHILDRGAIELQAAGVSDAQHHAELLLRQALGWSRVELVANLREIVPAAPTGYFFQLVERRRGRVPTQYLVGGQEFWSMEFRVTPAVLIPRPETELVVEKTLSILDNHGARPDEPLIADIGCGSGCITGALAKELPTARFLAVDCSPNALAVAQENLVHHGLSERVQFLTGDLYAPLQAVLGETSGCDLVVSNPPYVDDDSYAKLDSEVRDHEPRVALLGGSDGLDVVRRLIDGAPSALVDGGSLVFEIGFSQAESVRGLIDASPLSLVDITNDLQGIPRVVTAQKR